MKFNRTLAITALSGLMMASAQIATAADKAVEETVMCYGVNSCKGQAACSGKVDSCAGKNACNTEVHCAGHNSCKGKGLIKLSKKECLAKKGTVAQAK